MRKAWAKVGAISVVLGGLSYLAVSLWMQHVVDTSLRIQADTQAAQWVESLESSVPDLDALLAGAPITPTQIKVINATKTASSVFEIQLFNDKGEKIYGSAVNALDEHGAEDLNPHAVDVLQTGAQKIIVSDPDASSNGDDALPSGPYLAAYLPLFFGGNAPVGVAELYIDSATTTTALRNQFGVATATTLVATAFLLIAPGLAILRQFDRLKARDQVLRETAHRDDLTGLLNRRGFRKVLNDLERSAGTDTQLTFFHIDLDKFKAINDVNGHRIGDSVLREVGQILASKVGDHAHVARIGGDEFLVCLAEHEPDTDAYSYADGLRDAIIQTIVIEGRNFTMGVSIGVARWQGATGQTTSEKPEVALQAADIALTEAKSRGRNSIVESTPDLRQARLIEAQRVEEARKGLETGAFTTHFQPVTDATGTIVHGFEALLRWHHPTAGLLTPNFFLKACEDAGLGDALIEIVFDEVARFGHALQSTRLATSTISINLSGTQLKRPDCAARYLAFAEEAGLRPAQIRLEILESTLLEDRDSPITDTVLALHAAGFPIDLDDFGTGHTAINSLRRFPVSRIKIDKSLLTGIAGDASLQAMSRCLLDLGRNLEIDVLAEGIEHAADHETLKSLGYVLFQGFSFAPPMSRHDVLAWIAEDATRTAPPCPIHRDPLH